MKKQTTKKRNIIKIISFILLMLLITIGLSFAYFTANITGSESGTTITVGAGTMNITYSNNSSIITADNIYPRIDAWVTKTFTVQGNNTTNLDMAYSAYLIIPENTFSYNALSYTLESINTNSNGQVMTPTTENVGISTGASVNHLGNGHFTKTGGNKAHTYTLKVYFLDTGVNQNEDMGKTFNAYISLSGLECADCLTDNVLAASGGKELINTNQAPDFSKTAPLIHSYIEKPPVEVTSVFSGSALVGTDYILDTRAYQLQNTIEGWDYTYSQSDIGKYICDLYEFFDYTKCFTIYQIKEVSGGVVTKALKHEIDQTIYDPSTSGIFASEDDYGTSYYYRGAVENNYLAFAGMCWRIVRIVGDGSIKLALHNYNPASVTNPCDESEDGPTNAFARYSGTTYTSAFNITAGDAKYAGYMYGNISGTKEEAQANDINSTIKTNLTTWYNNKLLTYSNYLADTLWCNDRSIETGSGFGTGSTSYKTPDRLSNNKTPSLKCSQKNDRFTVSDTVVGNGKGGVPVGLLTADEIAFAGGVLGEHNTDNYLIKNASSSWWWSNSPNISYSGYPYMFGVGVGGVFSDNSSNINGGLRPVISLKSNTKITGLGTSFNPFKVVS